MRKKLAVLISNMGTGTNLQAIIDGVIKKTINANIIVVISDTRKALGLLRAKRHEINIEIVQKKENLLTILKKYNPDFVCLDGWKQFILDEIIDAYPQKIINLHPGLIPNNINSAVRNPDNTLALWNKEKLTNVAIKNFLDKHSTYAGSSIHFLTHDFDFGKVLGRRYEKIKKNDTVETLYKRLKMKENKLYVKVLSK